MNREIYRKWISIKKQSKTNLLNVIDNGFVDLAVVQIISISYVNFFDILSEKYLDCDLHLIRTSIIFLLEND